MSGYILKLIFRRDPKDFESALRYVKHKTNNTGFGITDQGR